MEKHEFTGRDAEARLIAHVVEVEAPALRDGGGVLVCGGSGGLREWLAADLASLAGGALVSHFIAVQVPVVDRARRAGLGVVLFTAMTSEDVIAQVHSGGMAGNGWPSGQAGVDGLVDVAQRFVHVTYDGETQALVLSSGLLR